MESVSVVHFILFSLGVFVTVSLLGSYAPRLGHVPGPFLARYTDLLRAALAVKYSDRETNLFMRLHSKYGDVVRVGPRAVSVLDPAAIPAIYGVKARLDKGPNVAAFNIPGIPKSILAIIDESTHARFRRPIQGAYSLSNLKNFEGYIDGTIDHLSRILDGYSRREEPINLSLFVYYWSYDTIGKLSFGSEYGYLEKESDFDGLISRQRQFVRYINLVTQAPSLHKFLLGNPIFKILPHERSDFISFTRAKVNERLAAFDDANKDRPDLLSHFMDMRKSYPDVVTDEQVFIYSLTNVIAGSLSTSHVLDELVRYLTTHPSAQQRIYDELKQAVPEIRFPIMFDDAKKSPYLDAVIQEGIRIHSMANLSSERVVGPGGMTLPSGMILPPGTYVGINPAAMNRRLDVYGQYPDQFDPTRWMRAPGETDLEFSERRLRMDRTDLTFGHGSRSCLGKNIVQLELMKLIASLCYRFKLDGVGEQQLYKVFCKVERRET